MARYINADELYKATQKRIAEANEARMAVVDDEFLDLINDAFTEDVAPRAEWISVDERLPESFETVLVFCDTGVRKFQCVSEMIEPNGKKWFAVCGFRVTHWMPLPEPPQMKGGE